MPTAPPGHARGIDTSHYNGDISHALASVDYAIAQASVGTWTDPAYAGDARSMQAAGVNRGAYHYAVYGPGPTRQAQKFLSVIATGPQPQFLAVDAETRGSNRLLDHPATITALIVNIRRLDKLRRPILLYASRLTSVIDKAGHKVPIWRNVTAQDGNWVADYAGAPDRPGIALKVPWLFWQYSGTGIDKDVFNGSVADLHRWIAGNTHG